MSTLETRIAKDISSAEFEFQAALRNSPLRGCSTATRSKAGAPSSFFVSSSHSVTCHLSCCILMRLP